MFGYSDKQKQVTRFYGPLPPKRSRSRTSVFFSFFYKQGTAPFKTMEFGPHYTCISSMHVILLTRLPPIRGYKLGYIILLKNYRVYGKKCKRRNSL